MRRRGAKDVKPPSSESWKKKKKLNPDYSSKTCKHFSPTCTTKNEVRSRAAFSRARATERSQKRFWKTRKKKKNKSGDENLCCSAKKATLARAIDKKIIAAAFVLSRMGNSELLFLLRYLFSGQQHGSGVVLFEIAYRLFEGGGEKLFQLFFWFSREEEKLDGKRQKKPKKQLFLSLSNQSYFKPSSR